MLTKNTLSFHNLVESHQNRVINICYGFVKNKEDAEDLAQEVFIEIYRSLSKFNNKSSISTWIYRIAVNKSLDHIRKSKRKKRFAYLKSIFEFNNEGEEISDKSEKNPVKILEEKERSIILRQAVDKLPENQRIAILLNKYENFKYKETAEIMGISLSALESLLHRANKKLRIFLYDYYKQKI